MHDSRGAGERLLQDRNPAWLRAGNSVYPRVAIAPGGTNKMTVRAIIEEKPFREDYRRRSTSANPEGDVFTAYMPAVAGYVGEKLRRGQQPR